MDENCSVYQTVDIIAKKWVLVILLTLYKGFNETLRYSEIKEQLPGITPKVLSLRLKELENHGIVTKQIDASEFPVKCHYSLTGSGKDIVNIIKDIKRWALRWKIKNELCERLDCKECEL